MKILPKLIHGILGAILVLGGAYTLFQPNVFLPAWEENLPPTEYAVAVSESLKHITIEFGAAFLTVGLLHVWSIFNSEKSTSTNYILLLFWFMMSAIHWVEFMNGNRTINSPLINSIPLILMGICIFLTPKSKS